MITAREKVIYGAGAVILGLAGAKFGLSLLNPPTKPADQYVPLPSSNPVMSISSMPLKNVEPAGKLEVKLQRIQIPNREVVGISNLGDYLCLVDKASQEFLVVRPEDRSGKEGSVGKTVNGLDSRSTVRILPDGTLIQMADQTGYSGTSTTNFPFNTEANYAPMYADGSIVAGYKDAVFFKNKAGQIQRFDPGPNSGRSGRGRMQLFVLIREKHKLEWNSQFRGVSDNVDYQSIMFQSRSPATPLSASNDSLWISEHVGDAETGQDILRHITSKGIELIEKPNGHDRVERVKELNGVVIATFYGSNNSLPYRSFVKSGATWTELPIPAQFNSSFVQQILSDGRILGYVTAEDGLKVEPVVWKGGKIAMLRDDPAWPKGGAKVLFTCAHPSGEFAVRNMLPDTRGTSEYYAYRLQ